MKKLPQAVELEKSVIGGILSRPELIMEIENILKPECFYKSDYIEIYTAILEVFRDSDIPDILTVSDKLKSKNKLDIIGGVLTLSETTETYTNSFSVLKHARIIYENYLKRQLIKVSAEIQEKAFDDMKDVSDALQFAQKTIFNINEISISKEPEHISQLVSETLENVQQAEKDEKPIGVHTSFRDISFYKSHLTIIGARPSMGKTFMAIKFAYDIAVYDVPVLVFSLEMSKEEMAQRFISLVSGTDSADLRNAQNVEWEKIEPCVQSFDNLPVYIDDTPALSIWQIISKSRKMKMKHKIGAIIIDYMQLSTAKEKGANREQEISTISRGFKTLAKELNIPIIALSQLNRLVESRGNKKPILSDLRESGAIEQDADRVLFLHREYYYSNDLADAGIGEIYDGKNRHGKLAKCNYYHSLNWSNISENPIEDKIEFKQAEKDDDFDF